MCWGFKVRIRVKPVLRQQKTLETKWFQGFRVVRGTGLELMQRVPILCCQRPESVANAGFFRSCCASPCREMLPDFTAIRLKIRLNFVAARNVPVPLAQKTRWTDDSPLPKSRGCFCGVSIHTKKEPPTPCTTRNWRFFL